jgi:hypothetical protein
MSDVVRGGLQRAPGAARRNAGPAPPGEGAPATGTAGASEPAPLAGPDGAANVLADVARLVEVARARRREPAFPWDALRRAVTALVVSPESATELFCRVADPATPLAREHLVAHHVRVAVMAVRVGAALGLDRARLLDLGSAGSLIDVGLWPDAAEAGSGDAAADAFRAHPERSAAIVRGWAGASERVVEAIAQHHERADGQGFPRGLAGTAIAEMAGILGLVDHYATLTSPPPGEAGARLRPDEAIRSVVRGGAALFPPAAVRAFVAEISILPPGTLVRLSTGEIARVVAVLREHPLRPRVAIGGGGAGRPRTVDLSRVPSLHITGTVSGA